jgi:hypothetical protein
MGSLLLAPIFWVIGEGMMEQLLGFAADVDGDTSSRSASTGFGLRAIANEFTDIVGPVTTAWILISWPRLQGLVPPLIEPAPVSTNLRNTKSVSDIDDKPVFSAPEWRQSLPSELGDDLIAVVSELQYLRVWTVRGTALVL